MNDLVLTVDELRGLDRWLTDLSLPWFVTFGDVPDLRVDAAALRGLAARELAVLPPAEAGQTPQVVLAPMLAHRLAPCQGAALLAEVDVEAAGEITRYAVAAGADGPVTLLTELPAGLVRLATSDVAAAETVRRLCHLSDPTDLIDDPTDPTDLTGPTDPTDPTGLGFVVYQSVYAAAADDQLLAHEPDGAVATLVAGGAPEAAARAWVAAITGRRRTVLLRAAVRPIDRAGQPRGGELRWLVSGDGTLWRIGAAQVTTVRTGNTHNGGSPTEADWADEEPSELVEVAPIGAAELGRAVADLVTVGTAAPLGSLGTAETLLEGVA